METNESVESVNVAIVRGRLSSPAEVRVLPSDQVLVQLQVTTRVDGEAQSVPVSVLDPASWVETLDTGDDVVVVGKVRRRFFRAGGATASRVELHADLVGRARDRRRAQAAVRRIEAIVATLEGG
jgi:single-strand DNA-binding protein